MIIKMIYVYMCVYVRYILKVIYIILLGCHFGHVLTRFST